MNIVIYGVSKSGKDYLINDLVNYLSDHSYECEHLRGSHILNELSSSLNGKPFSMLSENEKDSVRQRFASEVIKGKSQEKIYIVDGHCSFYSNENADIFDVITDADVDAYDYFFYLDTEAEVIMSRLNNSDLSISDINNLKNHEIDILTNRLLDKNKELHIIDYYDSFVLEYILSVIKGDYSSESIAKKLVLDLKDTYSNVSVILLDCDKTLSLEDSTSIALKAKGISEDELKRIYRDDRYTNYQAVRAKRYIEENKVFDNNVDNTIEERIHLNDALIQDLKEKSDDTKLIAITAGNSRLWQSILTKSGLDIFVLDSDYIVSKYVKYYILKELQAKCRYVLPIGDSMIDSLMLSYANKSYLISNKGYREKIYQLLNQNKSIYQLSYNGFLYEGIRTDEHITEIKSLEQTKYVMDLIEECKSTSGIEGYQLRQAHYKLGKEVGKMIKDDNPKSDYCVVIMMRSGLPFGQGIADHLDCPEIFCYNNNVDQIVYEINSNPELNDKILIICDGVVNSGRTVNSLASRISCKKMIATNVISNKYKSSLYCPIYATRISINSYVGAKQRVISEGKGPDTSDRLFRTM